jgi:hypothetical protein
LVICLDAPACSGFLIDIGQGNTKPTNLSLEYNAGGVWKPVTGLSDGTSGGGISFDHSGLITWDQIETEYQALYEVPGFWFRLKWDDDLSINVELSRVAFNGKPCQELQVIGDGQTDLPMVYVYNDVSENVTADYTVEVSDNTIPSVAYLNDRPESGTPVPMGPGDWNYTGYLVRFNGTTRTLHPAYNNQNVSDLSAEYWDGENWTALTIEDGTSEDGITLTRKGKISWSIPDNWRTCRPLGHGWPTGYYVRFGVSAAISEKTFIAEVRVHPIEDTLAKHKYVVTFRDRMVLLNRPDAPDQLTISRRLEEYGWTGEDSASLRVGGQDELVGGRDAFNQVFTAKTEAWYMLNGYNPSTFAAERAETGGQTPINNHVIIAAPYTDADGKNKQALAFINQYGAWVFTGLQAVSISLDVNWWESDGTNPRLDLNNLYKATGVFLPSRNWLVWSVPMITGDDTEQTTCNRLICYDLTSKTWRPPDTLTAASLGVAYLRSPGAPGDRGQVALYAGDYQGRISRFYTGETDYGNPISAWGRTGFLNCGSPEWLKSFLAMIVFGSGESVSFDLFVEGGEIPAAQFTMSGFAGATEAFASHGSRMNIDARYVQLQFNITGPGEIDCISLHIGAAREWLQL